MGAVSLVRFALGLWPLAGALKGAGNRLGARAAAVLLPWSEAAIEVDKPADLELVRKILGRDR